MFILEGQYIKACKGHMACSLFVLDSNLGSIAYQIDGFGKAHVISKGLNLLRLKPRLSIVPASKGWHEKYTRRGIIPIILDLAHGECLINENTNGKNTKSNPRSQMHSGNWFGLKSFLRITYHNAIEYLLHAWLVEYSISFNFHNHPMR